MRHLLSTFGVAVLLIAAVGCGQSRTTATAGDGITFSEDILPILQEDFQPLLTEETGLSLDSWSSLIEGSDYGEVLIPYDAERSLLIELADLDAAGGPSAEELDLVRRWINAGARNDDGLVPYAEADQLLYVCNQGSAVISIVDMESNLVIRTVDLQDLGFSENAKPHDAAVSPDGSYWYVSLIGENTILKFNRENELIGRVSFEVPGMLALDPAEQDLYVGRSMSAVNPPQRIGAVERGQMDVEEIDVFFPRPHAIDVTQDGRFVYSASLAVNQIASIDTETLETEVHEIEGPHHSLVQFALAPNEPTMIAGGEMSGQLLFFDVTAPMMPTVVKTIDLGGAPWHPSFSPDGSLAYVPRKSADAVSVVDMGTRTEIAVVSGEGLSQPHGSAVRSDGRYVYVTNNNLDGAYASRHQLDGDPPGTVTVIDAASNQIVKVIEVENYPTGLGARPLR